MEHYKTFLQEKWHDENGNDQFYIDNEGLVRLYFSVWSAIREYKDTDKIMFFDYNGETEWAEVQVFDNAEEIQDYYDTYFSGE